MLNTDLHKSQTGRGSGSSGRGGKQRKKMSRAEFINNLRDVNNSEEFSRDYLTTIYDSIEAHPIVIYHQTDFGNGSQHGASSAAQNSVYISGVAPTGVGDGAGGDLMAMIKSLIRSVKPSQELLRGLAVHEHPFHDIGSYEHGRRASASGPGVGGMGGSSVVMVVPKDLVWTALRYTWHHFLSIVNSTLETAHLDPKGLESCLDVLRYSIGATICLDMAMESSAFITQLSRVKFFNQNRELEESGAGAGAGGPSTGGRNDEWFERLEKACSDPSSTNVTKINAVDQVNGVIDDLRSSLRIDSRQKREIATVSRRIRNGEILLNDPTRFFIREGDLAKRGNRTGRSVRYHFFLFSDMLVYAHKSSSSGVYKIHEELPLHLMKITDYALDGMSGNARMRGSFHIQHPRKSFLASAYSGELKNSWMRDINSAIKKDVERKARMEGARLASAVKGTPMA
uniref:PH domain-containing protein n=1 Tax=Odontella aurita TaxID=265563 RepID=A0A7S4MMM8_9STRA